MNLNFLSSLLAANEYRIFDLDLPRVLPGTLNWPAELLIVLGLIAFSIAGGILFARAVRLPDYGWKIGLILSTLLVSLFIVLFGEFKMGVDLKGGVILVYEVDEEQTAALNPKGAASQWNMSELIGVLTRRLNPEGLKEIVVRPFGPKQVEIVVPETDPREVEGLKEKIRTGGVLQFMIVASSQRDGDLIQRALQQAEGAGRLKPDIVDSENNRIGFWARLGREEGEAASAPFRSLEVIETGVIRDARTGEIIDLAPQQRGVYAFNDRAFKDFLAQRGTRDVDVLMVYDTDFEMRGEDLGYVSPGRDETLRPMIHFATKGVEAAYKLGELTRNNVQRKLAIIFDNVLLSAPVIQERISEQGRITGNFSQEEVDFIVGILRSGSMPVVLKKQPISENQIGSILGRDTIEQGSRSVIVALGLIFAFMALYYRISGLVACFALGLNLLLTIAIMVLLQAPFTLPGLAGLVLTVAMSVDANVLISERMREELQRGAALRMAIRNGFDKALSAIVDGNLTTFLTALVLYAIGTDQIRGFGIVLMLGNITSMYTAIFVARVILDVGERTRWLKTLSMARILTNPQVDWVRFFVPAAVGSVLLIMIGLGATVARGKGLFDIDLAGGTSVTFLLKNLTPEEVVRQRLDAVFKGMKNPATNTQVDHNVYGMTVETQPANTVYKVDSSLEDVELLKEKVREALRLENGEDGLKTFQMEVVQLTESRVQAPAPPSISGTPPARPAEPGDTQPPDTKDKAKADTKTKDEARTDAKPAEQTQEKAKPAEPPPPPVGQASRLPSSDPGAETDNNPDEEEQSTDCGSQPASDQPATSQPESKADAQPKADAPATPEAAKQPGTPPPPASPAPSGAAPLGAGLPTPPTSTPLGAGLPTPPSSTPKFQTKALLRFPGSGLGADALRERLSASAKAVINEDILVQLDNPNWDPTDNSAFPEWTVTLPVEQEQAAKILEHAEAQLEGDVIWQTSSKIGGQVSEDTRWRAVGALAVSLLGIVAYVWFRFQKVAWGLAAVAALAHDALVMLTAIALSFWFASSLGIFGIEEFKISLPVVAAFLTILGYSVNDTIVIFDRLREIRGKSPNITRQMLNDAVNQTLSRTIILAGITLTVVLILYAFGGSGIHAFAFALVTGVISGCYTTLVIAAPMLLWLLNRGAIAAPTVVEKRERDQVGRIVPSR